MRVFAQFVAIWCLAAFSSITAQSPQPPPKKDAAAILAQTREALGGEKRLSAVKNFVATGRTRQVRGDNLPGRNRRQQRCGTCDDRRAGFELDPIVDHDPQNRT